MLQLNWVIKPFTDNAHPLPRKNWKTNLHKNVQIPSSCVFQGSNRSCPGVKQCTRFPPLAGAPSVKPWTGFQGSWPLPSCLQGVVTCLSQCLLDNVNDCAKSQVNLLKRCNWWESSRGVWGQERVTGWVWPQYNVHNMKCPPETSILCADLKGKEKLWGELFTAWGRCVQERRGCQETRYLGLIIRILAHTLFSKRIFKGWLSWKYTLWVLLIP